MELYYVETKCPRYHGCKDVTFQWFLHKRSAERRPYAELIQNYAAASDHERFYAEDHVDQMFTREQAKQLVSYLDRAHGDEKTTIREVELPIRLNVMGVGAIPVGGGDDFYMLDREAEYTLPFAVWGYFNLVGCELIDGVDVFRHRLLLLSSDGGARWQTNKEAAANELSI